MTGEILLGVGVVGLSVGIAGYVALSTKAARLDDRTGRRPVSVEYGRHSPQRVSRTYRNRVAAEWPRFLEGIVIALTSGMQLQEAIGAACRGLAGPLRWEMDRVVLELGAGKPAHRCLGDLSRKLGLQSISRFHFLLTQAEILGTPLAETCTVLAEEAYREMRQEMEYKLNALPVKLAVASSLLLLPPVVLITIAPGVLAFLRGW